MTANGQHSWRTPGLNAAAIVTVSLTLFPTLSCQEVTKRQYDTPEGRQLLAQLAPPRAELLTQTEEEDGCFLHLVRKLRSSRPAVEAWAERLRLRCTDPDPTIRRNGLPVRIAPGTPCTEWRGDEPEVIADLKGSVITIDSTHDYLCSGPW